jgi:hypothetical protein
MAPSPSAVETSSCGKAGVRARPAELESELEDLAFMDRVLTA